MNDDYLGYSFFQVLNSNPPLKNHPISVRVYFPYVEIREARFETSNHQEKMKTNSTISPCLNKVIVTVVGLCLFITGANASGLPVFPSVYKNVTNPTAATAISGVVYASINAMANERSVTVKWITASELNNSHFEVERSLDMRSYKTVALVLDGFEAEGTGKSYQFKEDAAVVRNGQTVFYRLKQFNTDGQVSYSSVMAVKLQTKEVRTIKMELTPNPATDQISVRLTGAQNGLAEIRIVSLAGKVLLSKQSTINKGHTNIQVEGLNKLATGMYLAQLIMNGTVIENQKLLKK
jgi:hypothetical protein